MHIEMYYMIRFVLLLLCQVSVLVLYTQEDSVVTKPKWYKAMIETNAGSVKGYLYSITDSGLVLISKANRNKTSFNSDNAISAGSIQVIKLRADKSIQKAILLSVVVGTTIGAVIGFASGDDPCSHPDDPNCGFFGDFLAFTAAEKAFMFGSAGATLGAGVGVAIGIIKIRIPINGDRQKFMKNRNKLLRYAWMKQ